MSNTPETRVSCRYGAPMGRPSQSSYIDRQGREVALAILPNAPPCTMRRVRLDRGGYDQGGAYWGHAEPLYYYEGPISDINGYVRGATREAAKAAVRATHPHARFYR